MIKWEKQNIVIYSYMPQFNNSQGLVLFYDGWSVEDNCLVTMSVIIKSIGRLENIWQDCFRDLTMTLSINKAHFNHWVISLKHNYKV